MTHPLPQITEGEAAQFEHTSYVLITRCNLCTGCAAQHHHSDFHEVWTHPYRTAANASRILKPTTSISPGFPIAAVVMPTTCLPVCHECITTHNSMQANSQFAFPSLSHTAWAETLQRKAVAARAAATATAKARTTPTLDQL